ncbi:MAG: hypothetical protein ABI832_06615 [bacterium]
MTHPIPGPLDIARIATETAEALVEEEMRLLAALNMPPKPLTDAEKKERQDEIDAGFDNLPV